MDQIKVPSFRRKVTGSGWETEQIQTEPKVRITKFTKTTKFETSIFESMYIYLDCGHKVLASGRSKDITLLKSMDCWECSVVWQDENNCDWQGNHKI